MRNLDKDLRFVHTLDDEKAARALHLLEKRFENQARIENAPPLKALKMDEVDKTALERENYQGLTTGISKIDSPLYLGGFQQGSVYILGGTTSVGKTQVCCNLVMRTVLRTSVKTLFVTTEMPAWSVSNRLWNIWLSITGYTEKDAREDFRMLPIEWVDGTIKITPEIIHQFLETGEYKFLVIDNLQWFTRGGDNVAESTGIATQLMKEYAVEFDIPVIVVSHLNREAYSTNEPRINQLKGSSYIEQDADAVLLVSRNWQGDTNLKYPHDVTRISCQKNRLTGNLMTIGFKSNSFGYLEEHELSYYE